MPPYDRPYRHTFAMRRDEISHLHIPAVAVEQVGHAQLGLTALDTGGRHSHGVGQDWEGVMERQVAETVNERDLRTTEECVPSSRVLVRY